MFSVAVSKHDVFNMVNMVIVFFNSKDRIWSFFQIPSVKLQSFLYPCRHSQDYLFLFLHTQR